MADDLTRRDFLKRAAALGMAAGMGGVAGFDGGAEALFGSTRPTESQPNLTLWAGHDKESETMEFKAVGPSEPVKLEPHKKGAVEVTFDQTPTKMRFNLPAYPCMVTENDIQYSNCYTETYDPRIGGGSFEVHMDRRNTYARMWIESQNDARIIVRCRGALADSHDNIAHTDIPSGSPHGDGDWTDEWYYIYPDATHVRHVRIYTGLAPRSRPFGFDREPPNVVHEFMESSIFGQPGHVPTDDIETDALTLILMISDNTEYRIPGGKSMKIPYQPYPRGFGEFRDANIVVVNLKSKYHPFTIALPYGVRVQPYPPEGELPWVFQTWGNPPERGYVTALGHILNMWHYRRTDTTLEQIYLSGMTTADDPAKELIPLAWSWINAPKLRMEGLKASYDVITYNPAQNAYVLSCDGPKPLEFSLEVSRDLVNPVFVLKGWGQTGASLTINQTMVERGRHFRLGHETNGNRTDLILWISWKATEPIEVKIAPAV